MTALLLLAGCGLFFHQQKQRQEDTQRQMEAGILRHQEAALQHALPPPGDGILQHYADTQTKPEADLEALAHTFSNLLLLVKSDTPFRMGANEEFAAALRGTNAGKLRFVSANHRLFNAHGQAVDRWHTPLYFHASGGGRLDIRSAGPDRQMWTEDDVHRRYDGSFLRGAALNPASLYDPEAAPPSRR